MHFPILTIRRAAGLFLAALLTFLVPAAFAAEEPPKPGPSWGLHGMLLFGGPDGLYASHLPMFHAPHDRQVLLAIKLADPALDAQMRRTLGEHPTLWTLVPEQFELARLAPRATDPLKTFRADIVEGHFERDGTPRHQGVTVEVLRVERYRVLKPALKPVREAIYRPVGAGSTWFLVKDIGARPDFDHVVAVRGPRKPVPIVLAVTGITQPPDEALRRRLPTGDVLLGTVYFDTADLK
jgi:hypothetical protein